MELTQSVLSVLDPDRIDAMAHQIGASPQQTERAIEAALPLLLEQLARNTAHPQGARTLQQALANDHAQVDLGTLMGAVLGGRGGTGGTGGGGGLGGALGGVLGGGAARHGGALGDGAAILRHIFGSRQRRVEQSVGQFGGMNGQQSGRLLQMLAPIVMALLARAMQSRGGTEPAVGQVLEQEQRGLQQRGAGGLLGAVLDRDGDGDVDLSDLMRNGQLLGGLFGRR
jgi:hypothetical protein